MKKIFITGATDGIGLETARKLSSLGHEVLVHGRSKEKLERVSKELNTNSYRCDLSDLSNVNQMIDSIKKDHSKIDVLINNAGVFKTSNSGTKEGFDIRFVVNTFAPYLITKRLLPELKGGRVLNLSSAAQSSVDFKAMQKKIEMDDYEAYAQSKLAITMWSRNMACSLGSEGPVVIAVNPGSLLATNMVKEAFQTAGNDIKHGVNILTSLSLDEEHASHSGKYYDNDNQRYAEPKEDGPNDEKAEKIVQEIEQIINEIVKV